MVLACICICQEMDCVPLIDSGRYIIINADDFGYCQKRNSGILYCRNESAVTSVSVLVNGEKANEVRCFGTSAKRPFSIGLHFNISEGIPLSPVSLIPTLLNKKQCFLGKFHLHEAAISNHISANEVATELRAQIEAFKKLMNCSPSHVDGHQHVHILPGIREAFAKVLHSENIQWTRMPIELGIEDCFWLDSSQKNFFKLINEMAKESSKLFKEHGLKYADSFIGMSIMGKNMTLDKLKHAITKTFKMNSPYICELMVHPGYAAVAEVGGCGEGPDDFALSSEREHEIEVLCSKEWKTFLSENMQPISFRDAADLQHDGIFSV